MATQVEVANSALAKLGAATILSLDDDTKEARYCKLRLHPVRKVVLRMHPWNCAVGRVELAATTDVPAFDFEKAMNLPSDCLRVLQVVPDDVEYRVEGKQILCNETSIDLLYIRDETDFTKLDELLAEAIACYLAWDIGYPITQSNTVVDRVWKQFEAIKKSARSIDAQEERGYKLTAESIVTSRIQGTGGFRDPSTD